MNRQFSLNGSLWAPILLCLVLQAVYLSQGFSPALDGGLIGPDSYMRLARVRYLMAGGDWFSNAFPLGNAPYGEFLHWTRPFDALLIAGAWLATPFAGLEDGLFWSGVWIGPVLQLATLAALDWGMRPVLDGRQRLLLGLLFLLQPAMFADFMAGRADHHGLNLLLFVLAMGCTIRLLLRPFRAPVCIAAGLVAALALWVSVESMAALFVNIAVLGLFWVFAQEDFAQKEFARRDFARKGLYFSVSLLAATTAALLLERSAGEILVPEYDRISVVAWTALALNAAVWAALAVLERRGLAPARPSRRLLVSGICVALAAICLGLAFPKFYDGPLAGIDPAIIPIWLDLVPEIQPLVDPDRLAFGPLIYWLGMALPAIPALVWLAWREPDPERRRAWIYLCAGTALFVPLTLYQMRAVGYAVLLLLPAFAVLLGRVLDRIEAGAAPRLRALAGGLAVAVFLFGPPMLGTALQASPEPADSDSGTETGANVNALAARASCPLGDLARLLNDPRGLGDRPRTIVASVNFGPELLYRTRHRVIATPYHRNGAGILAVHRLMSAAEDADALALARAREVDLILLCPDATEAALFAGQRGKSTFYLRLLRDALPAWLRPVALAPEFGEAFRLFELAR